MTPQQQLKSIWSITEYGVKSRVFNSYSQQQIDYILKNPNYSNTNKVLDIIECIKIHSKELLDEVKEMYNQIESI